MRKPIERVLPALRLLATHVAVLLADGPAEAHLLDTTHPFYSRVFATASVKVTSALEAMHFVLADGEVEALADGQRATFYKAEGHHWSELLSHALASLVLQATLDDEASLEMELDEQNKTVGKCREGKLEMRSGRGDPSAVRQLGF